jgi:hypothetical protein
VEENQSQTRVNSRELQGLLDFMRPAPLFLTVQAYRTSELSPEELTALDDHLNSWREILIGNGIAYEGVLVNNQSEDHADLLYHLSTMVNSHHYPGGLPLLLDALFELSKLIPAEWELHVVEQVVTRFEISESEKGWIPSSRVFPQQIKGKPSAKELMQSPDVITDFLFEEA